MSAFCRVDDRRAGPTALGILVPPGERTMVILRPRGLEWDLLPLRFDRSTASTFCVFGREEAISVAHRLHEALEGAAAKGERPAQIVTNPAGDGYLVWVPALDIMWMLCPRVPGRPYEPAVFVTEQDANDALDRLSPYLWPAANAGQEYYFNTQNFTRRLKIS